VQFILRNDHKKVISFVPIQHPFTRNLFEKKGWDTPDLSTFYFLNEQRLFEKSSAALELSKFLRYPYRLLICLKIVPRKLRDKIYDFIAARRTRISKGFCVIPSIEDQQRFMNLQHEESAQ
jgi:predicted DCC family thiol-disulfide oxidoreductase YuxK